jgi:hypothetical protein
MTKKRRNRLRRMFKDNTTRNIEKKTKKKISLNNDNKHQEEKQKYLITKNIYKDSKFICFDLVLESDFFFHFLALHVRVGFNWLLVIGD